MTRVHRIRNMPILCTYNTTRSIGMDASHPLRHKRTVSCRQQTSTHWWMILHDGQDRHCSNALSDMYATRASPTAITC